MDSISILLLIGGFLGGFLRAALGKGPTWEWLTVYHVLSGGAIAVLAPATIKWLTQTVFEGPPLFWICGGFCVGLVGNYVLVAIMWKIGAFKNDPRNGGEPK